MSFLCFRRIADMLMVGPGVALAFNGAVEFDVATGAALHFNAFFFEKSAAATHSVRHGRVGSVV